MERTFETFYPGQYNEREQAALEKARAAAEGKAVFTAFVHGEPKTIHQHELLGYARLWNPQDPLYNDPEYAKKTKIGRLPAFGCAPYIENISDFPMMDEYAADFGDLFYYGNDGGDIELYTRMFDGDTFTLESEGREIIDITPPEGSTTRTVSLIGRAVMKNEKGEIIGRGVGVGRNAFKRFTDGGPVPSDYEQTYEWLDYIPPVHYTTPEEWERIIAMWKAERVRGAETLYWDEVQIGDEPIPTCEPPIADINLSRLHYDMLVGIPTIRESILAGEEVLTDTYGQRINFVARHYSYCRMEGARAVFYNFTARNFILRMVTNWMGDDGFLCGIKWRFMNLYKVLSENCYPGAEFMDKVPHMKGKYANRHGMEGDAVICKGYVTDKYEKDGKYYVVMTCWGETLDGDIIQVMEVTVELPKK